MVINPMDLNPAHDFKLFIQCTCIPHLHGEFMVTTQNHTKS